MPQPIPFVSKQLQFSPGQTLKLDFKEFMSVTEKLASANITKIGVRIVGTADTGSAGGAMSQIPQLISHLFLNDLGGLRASVDGAEFRVINFRERGLRYNDFSTVNPTDVAPTTTAAPIDKTLYFTFSPRGAKRRADFRMNIMELFDGGNMQIVCASASPGVANGWSNFAGYFEVCAWVQDELDEDGVGKSEVKARMTYNSVAITQKDTTYPVAGRARWMYAYVGATNENAGTPFGPQSITSNTLGYTAIDTDRLREEAIDEGDTPPVGGSADPLVKGMVIPLIASTSGQKIPEMFAGQDCHVRFESTNPPSGASMIICSITNRSGRTVEKVLASPDHPTTHAAVADIGAVKLASGGLRHVTKYSASLAAHMPVRLDKRVKGKGKKAAK